MIINCECWCHCSPYGSICEKEAVGGIALCCLQEEEEKDEPIS